MRRWLTSIGVVAALIVPASALAAPGTEVVEKRVRSEAPGAKRVSESLVRVHDPLPPRSARTRPPATGSSTCASATPTARASRGEPTRSW